MGKFYENDDFFLILSGLLFLMINFEPKVSNIYLWMAGIGWFMYYSVTDKKVFAVPPLKKDTTSWTTGILYGLVAFAIFIFVNPIILNFTGQATTQSTVELMSSSFIMSTKPVLEANKYTSFVVWGFLIPYVQTIFFPTLWMLYLSHKFGYSLESLKGQLTLMSLVGIGAVFFHLTAKGITDNAALITTFVFFFINTYLVIKFREKIQAATMHIASNSIAINSMLKIWNIKLAGL